LLLGTGSSHISCVLGILTTQNRIIYIKVFQTVIKETLDFTSRYYRNFKSARFSDTVNPRCPGARRTR
ncbi:unnamed protein product, partial [Callosobruchus maculatus]